MRQWLRSPTLLKLLVGQHILNGISVAAGVMAVSLISSALFGFAAGQPATLGAISASISDQPAPLRRKALLMAVGFGIAIFSTLSIQLIAGFPWALIPAIAVIAFLAGLVTGYGRWALALSMQALVPMVFVLGLPPTSFAGALRNEAVLIGGGLAYIAIALLLTAITDAGGRRMMASEALREFSAYLRRVAAFYNPTIDLPEVYGAVIRQQAALSDQMQAARTLLLERPRASRERLRLAATIGILLDTLDALVAAHIELAELRATPATATLMARIAVTLRAASLDLQHLSLELLSNEAPSLPPDHTLAADALKREAENLVRSGELSPEALAAVQATALRIGDALGHIRRLEQALSDDEVASASIGDIDLAAFRARASFNPKLLTVHLTPNSPVFRFAARLALAMTAGALVAHSMSSEGHGNWILLTIAVIMRASYGLTRERRDDRVIGTLIGCLIAAAALATLPIGALIAVQALGLAIVHGFARLRYRIASVGASITALMSLHLIDPTHSLPTLTRIADTLVGAALAQLFSHVLPRWEFNEAPRLAQRLQSDIAAFAKVALDERASRQDYRMARKSMIEAIAALSDSAGRMGGEPQAVHRGLDEMAAMLIAGYVLAAHISATRLFMRERRGGDDFQTIGPRLQATREWLIGLLSDKQAPPDPAGPAYFSGPATIGALGTEFQRLRKAALALIAAAAVYRHAAAET
ncbi:FUSC family membrane protein [Methylocapsa sp. S129]|uniref:FUSC family protein n=1 Tax=Methylocapsa sp. S129 TaxID=1641869 RepID=UPI00131EB32C|nr:FUSC family membrane protein [Methylocapsa sp. S129]